MSGRRTRIGKGIYRDKWGFAVIWREHGRPREKRFPRDTPLATLKAWRDTRTRRVSEARQDEDSGSFPRDVVRFLRSRRSLASFKSDRSHLRPWARLFRRLSRFAVTKELVAQAIDDWKGLGYAARELRHRLRILKQLYRALDDTTATPFDRIKTPTPAKSRARGVADGVVRAVALELRKHELTGALRDAKTRARYLVDATCGQRPVQHMRATPTDLDLERRLWIVEPAKGDHGTVLYLNDDMLAAWTLFIDADAWGFYDRRSYAKVLRRCGWPKGVRPYTMRHSVGLSLSESGVDLGDIQQHMGHASMDTTRQFYVPGLFARAKVASEKLDGRMGVTTATPTAIFARTPGATNRENIPRSVKAGLRPGSRSARVRARKKA